MAAAAALVLAGCAATSPTINFAPFPEVPPDGLRNRPATAVVRHEPADALVAEGLIRLGELEVTAEHDSITPLLNAAARCGADAVSLHQNNLPQSRQRQQCTDITKPGEPSYCLDWDTDTGICRLWSAPVYFECNKWDSARAPAALKVSRATLWRREPLAAAIVQGEDAVRAALAAGADPNATWAPLFYAIDRPGTGAVRALLEGGALADVRALGHAARSAKTAAVETLLAAGAPVNQGYVRRIPPPGQHTTVMHEAVRGGNPQIVELLIACGADVNAIPSFGSTALKEAVASANLEVVRVLLAHGANPRLKDLNGISALDEAVKRVQSDAGKTDGRDVALSENSNEEGNSRDSAILKLVSAAATRN